jgi:hypothetical protein
MPVSSSQGRLSKLSTIEDREPAISTSTLDIAKNPLPFLSTLCFVHWHTAFYKLSMAVLLIYILPLNLPRCALWPAGFILYIWRLDEVGPATQPLPSSIFRAQELRGAAWPLRPIAAFLELRGTRGASFGEL